jgi:hypothetical protein
MGNLLSACFKPSTSQEEEERRKQQQYQQQYPYIPGGPVSAGPYQQPYGPPHAYPQQTGPPAWQGPQPVAPYSYAAAAAHAGTGAQGPVAAVARDLLQFETTGQVSNRRMFNYMETLRLILSHTLRLQVECCLRQANARNSFAGIPMGKFQL